MLSDFVRQVQILQLRDPMTMIALQHFVARQLAGGGRETPRRLYKGSTTKPPWGWRARRHS
jgi:hypothetical protein